MIGQRHCPLCNEPALTGCRHLALAVEARDFVRHCVEKCQGEGAWQTLRAAHRADLQLRGEWSSEQEDFTWLETAFCEKFLKQLRWFGGIDYEWRTGAKLEQGGFWVLLWSREPQRLWWELRDEFDRQAGPARTPSEQQHPAPWLVPPPASLPVTSRESARSQP